MCRYCLYICVAALDEPQVLGPNACARDRQRATRVRREQRVPRVAGRASVRGGRASASA